MLHMGKEPCTTARPGTDQNIQSIRPVRRRSHQDPSRRRTIHIWPRRARHVHRHVDRRRFRPGPGRRSSDRPDARDAVAWIDQTPFMKRIIIAVAHKQPPVKMVRVNIRRVKTAEPQTLWIASLLDLRLIFLYLPVDIVSMPSNAPRGR